MKKFLFACVFLYSSLVVSAVDTTPPQVTGFLMTMHFTACDASFLPYFNSVSSLEMLGVSITDDVSLDENIQVIPSPDIIMGGCPMQVTRTYTLRDEAGNVNALPQIFIIHRPDFIMPANGSSTVSCPSATVAPTLPIVVDGCGNVLTPTGPVVSALPACEGIRIYTYTYTDCEAHTHNWEYTYTVNYSMGLVPPANGASTVSCPSLAVAPAPPADITDACGRTVTPVLVGQDALTPSCEGSVVWRYRYTACDGTTADWTHTYTIERTDFTYPIDGTMMVDNIDATDAPPTLPSVNDACGNIITSLAPVVSAKPTGNGSRTYSYKYMDCEGNEHDWIFTYYVSLPTEIKETQDLSENVFATNSSIVLKGLQGEYVQVLDVKGVYVYSGQISSVEESIPVAGQSIYFVRVKEKSIKVFVK